MRNERFIFIIFIQDTDTCYSFNSSYSRSDTCFAENLESTYLTGILNVSSSAEFFAEITNGYNSYCISVFFSKERSGTFVKSLLYRHYFCFYIYEMADFIVYDIFNLLNFFIGHTLEVIEVKSQTILGYR